MLYEFLIVGGVLFWIIALLAAIAIVAAIEYDSGQNATIVAVAFVAIMVLFSNVEAPFTWLMNNWLLLAVMVVAYIGVGGGWSVVKWYFHCLALRDNYREEKSEFLTSNNISGDTIPEELKESWKRRIGYGYKTPQVRENKATILMWMTYWPFSAFWTLLNDPIKRAFKWVYNRLGGMLQGISDKMFSEISNDFQK